jgi:uncharacterized linocin/CFP29 family protein
MNNLHRDLAPISGAAWAQIEEEARRTFLRGIAGRRVVDVSGPAGAELAAVDTGHAREIDPPIQGVHARLRESRPVEELRAPFTLSRTEIDNVERGSQDSDWQPVKDAATRMAVAEDRIVLDGHAAAGLIGIRGLSSNLRLALPADPNGYPDVVSRALTELRLAGVDGPYALLLGVEAYTAAAESADHGYPILSHLRKLLDGEPLWAPALHGALLVSTRGGDYVLQLGQDLSIGYLSHDADSVHLYLQEAITFLAYTAEASVVIESGGVLRA